MLESIYGKTQEFDQVTKKYQEIRKVLEQLLINGNQSEMRYITIVETEVDYKGVPLEVTVSIPLFRLTQTKESLKELTAMTINVSIENKISGIRESQDIPDSRCINADPKKVEAGTISIIQANNIVQNLEGVTSLLTAKTN